MLYNKLFKCTVLLLLLCFTYTPEAIASHFRGGTITWQETGNSNEIEFKITTSWRRSAFCSNSCLGTSVSVGTFDFGDNVSASLTGIVISESVSEDWMTTEATLTHSYSNSGNFTAYFEIAVELVD